MKIPFLRTVALISVATLAGLLLLTRYDAATYRLQLPRHLRYLPPHATLQLISFNFGEILDGLAAHQELNLLHASNGLVAKLPYLRIRYLRDLAASKCIFVDDVSVLEKYGINRQSPIIFGGFLNRIVSPQRDGGAVAVLPILDRDRFLALVATLASTHIPVQLKADHSRRAKPSQYVIRRLGNLQLGRLCVPTEGLQVEGHDVTLPAAVAAKLRFYPEPFKETTFQLACTVVYEDGTKSDCTCNAEASGDCTQTVSIPGSPPVYRNIGEHEVFSPGDSTISVAFPSTTIAVLSNRRDLLATALRNPQDNFAHHLNSVPMRHAIQHRERDGASSVGRLFGYVRVPPLLGLRALSFTIEADHSSVDVRFTVKLRHTGLAVIQRLATRSDDRPLPSPVNSHMRVVATQEGWAFLRFIARHFVAKGKEGKVPTLVDHIDSVTTRSLGGYAVSAAALHVVGARERFPITALAVRPSDAPTGRMIVRDLQRRLRSARDIAILEAAVLRFRRDRNKVAPTLAAVTDPNVRLILPEQSATWEYYVLRDNNVIQAEKLPDVIFEAASYQMTIRARRIEFVLPRFTANDRQYRPEIRKLSETEFERVSNDKDRMAAYYDEDTGILWFGTDAQAIQLSLAALDTVPVQTPASLPRGWSVPVITIHADPDWLIAQGIDHPETRVDDLAQSPLAGLGGYRTMVVTLKTPNDPNVFVANVRVSR